jgi:hypothetical protein
MVVPYDWLLESGFMPPAGFGQPRYVVMSWGNTDAYSQEGLDPPWKVFRSLHPHPLGDGTDPGDWDVAEVIPSSGSGGSSCRATAARSWPSFHGPAMDT